MIFSSLKHKCEYYRGLTDYRLLPNSYAIAMVDGRSFSKHIKKRFGLPFDETFISLMNESAKFVCEETEGCILAFVQSDEASFLFRDTDSDGIEKGSFFSYRLSKMTSVIASMMTAKFNDMFPPDISSHPLATFDCKAWNVPTLNDAYAWFLYRQRDCVRNSKQAVAQSVLPHAILEGLDTDAQIRLAAEHSSDWNGFPDGQKQGRLVYRDDAGTPDAHRPFVIHDAPILLDNREFFNDLILTKQS